MQTECNLTLSGVCEHTGHQIWSL